MGGSRNATRAIFGGVVLLLVVGWIIWSRPAALVRVDAEQGQVLSVNDHFGVVQIADGRKVRLVLPQPGPKAGEEVPLRVERFADGKARYSIDADAWRAATTSR